MVVVVAVDSLCGFVLLLTGSVDVGFGFCFSDFLRLIAAWDVPCMSSFVSVLKFWFSLKFWWLFYNFNLFDNYKIPFSIRVLSMISWPTSESHQFTTTKFSVSWRLILLFCFLLALLFLYSSTQKSKLFEIQTVPCVSISPYFSVHANFEKFEQSVSKWILAYNWLIFEGLRIF